MRRLASLAPLLLLVACGAPVDAAGVYTGTLTNGANACQLDLWTEGSRTEDLAVEVLQADTGEIRVDVGGVIGGAFLLVAAGDTVFDGRVSGNRTRAELVGANTFNAGDCSFRWTFAFDGRLRGDCLSAELEWLPQPDRECGVLSTCVQLQTFEGCRPPGE